MILETYTKAIFFRLPYLLAALVHVREVWVEVGSKEAAAALPWFLSVPEDRGHVWWFGRLQVAVAWA